MRRAFKAVTGITPLRYQQLLKLELAAAKLHDPNLTMEQVAHSVGFADARQLRRLWVQQFGQLPSRSRPLYRAPNWAPNGGSYKWCIQDKKNGIESRGL